MVDPSSPDTHDEPFLSDLLVALRFYSRLPVPKLAGEKNPYRLPDFDRITKLLPLASLIIALPSTRATPGPRGAFGTHSE